MKLRGHICYHYRENTATLANTVLLGCNSALFVCYSRKVCLSQCDYNKNGRLNNVFVLQLRVCMFKNEAVKNIKLMRIRR